MKLKKRLQQKERTTDHVKLLLKQGKTDVKKAIANLDDDISKLDVEINEQKSIMPLNTVNILSLINTKALKNRALGQTKTLYDELF